MIVDSCRVPRIHRSRRSKLLDRRALGIGEVGGDVDVDRDDEVTGLRTRSFAGPAAPVRFRTG